MYIEDFFKKYKKLTGAILDSQANFIVSSLIDILDKNIEGSIVEMGCSNGCSSICIAGILKEFGSNKEFHVYDSFEGLPDLSDKDYYLNSGFKKGSCRASIEEFISNLNKYNLNNPVIHKGWFNQIPDNQYPEKICFAFLDGDLYSSITDSFNKIYNKVVSNGVIIVHDYSYPKLPGVKLACEDFLKDKPEKLEVFEEMAVIFKK